MDVRVCELPLANSNSVCHIKIVSHMMKSGITAVSPIHKVQDWLEAIQKLLSLAMKDFVLEIHTLTIGIRTSAS